MNHSMIEVVFKVWKAKLKYSSVNVFIVLFSQVKAEIGYGEEVRLIGNVPALGCDDIARSIPLICSPATYPWWTTKEGQLLFRKLNLQKLLELNFEVLFNN